MNGLSYVLLGPPGAGKGTQAQQLAERLGALHLSTGEMLRAEVRAGTELGQQVAAVLAAGNLVSDTLMIPLVQAQIARMPASQPIIFDGFPRTREQAVALDETLAGAERTLGAALLIEVPLEELIRRLMARGREDDTRDVVTERIAVYARETLPLRDYYAERGLLQIVDGSGTMQDVTQRLLAAIGVMDNDEPL